MSDLTLYAARVPTFRALQSPITLGDSVTRVDFISDIHLCQEMPQTFQRLKRYIAETPADIIVILGDLFEVWVGDEACEMEFQKTCLEVLANRRTGVRLLVMHGNRDFLLGPKFLENISGELLPDPCLITGFGTSVLCTHGDAWCISDEPYQVFRRQVRQASWQEGFLAMPLDVRCALAAKLREGSIASQREMTQYSDIDCEIAARELFLHQTKTLVHGHTHRPGRFLLPNGNVRFVLSDWDFEGEDRRGDFLSWTSAGLKRHSLS